MWIWIWIVLGLAVLLSAILVIGSRRVNMPRVPSREGIEDGEAARAYDMISRWPQFRFPREMIVCELKKHRPHGILVVPPPIRNINEPTGSLLSSYTAGELESLLSKFPLEQRKIKPGFGWLFAWARKGRLESSTGH